MFEQASEGCVLMTNRLWTRKWESAVLLLIVAGDKVVLLSQALGRLGASSVPMPAALVPSVGRMLARGAWADFSRDQVRYLTHGRVLDTTRVAVEVGFECQYSSDDAFGAFVRGRRREVADHG